MFRRVGDGKAHNEQLSKFLPYNGLQQNPPLEQFPITLSVIAGLVPAISIRKALCLLIEMAGTSPAMTTKGVNLNGK